MGRTTGTRAPKFRPDRFERVLRYIARHGEQWDQTKWR